ncbi:hypothetical protein [Halobacillus seohaensis]|uniref:hypothetical protein n=1 Tax=Halobacillus seohaensis TaxID=447421 RepID=UPI0036F3E9E2
MNFLRDDQGIIFPWAISIASLILLVTLFTVQQYKNQLYSTESIKHYYQLQNMFNYGQEQFLELYQGSSFSLAENNYTFHLPIGSADVTCEEVEDHMYKCTWHITLKSGTNKTIQKIYELYKTDAIASVL